MEKFQVRAYYDGSLTVGKVQISHGLLFRTATFGGREVTINSDIEILVEH